MTDNIIPKYNCKKHRWKHHDTEKDYVKYIMTDNFYCTLCGMPGTITSKF